MKSSAYPKILHIGDKQIDDLFDYEVEVTEKLDGSQLGFGKIDGELVIRSKGKEIDQDNPEKMFTEGVEYVKSISDRLPDNMMFYAEYLQQPRHSTLAYDSIPTNHIALFGALSTDNHEMYNHDTLKTWADYMNIDTVPVIYEGKTNPEEAIEMVKGDSYLGGQQREGVVVKRYEDWMFLGKILIPVKAGKYVTEKFKEVHTRDWKKLNTKKGQLEDIKHKYCTEARWNKAIQHLREKGELEGSPRDIGPLIKEIQHDLSEEERENIKEDLWKLFSGDILRKSAVGFPEWYKEKLAKGEIE